MRRFRFTALIVVHLALAAGLRSTRAEPSGGFRLEGRVPASTLAFASLEGLGPDMFDRLGETGIGRFFADPEVKAFLAPIQEGFMELIEQGGGRGGPFSGMPPIVFEALEQLSAVNGQVAVALVDIDAEHEMPRVVASLDFGSKVDEFVAFLERLRSEIDPDGQHLRAETREGRQFWSVADAPVPIVATVVDTALVLATDEGLLLEAVRGGGEGSLGGSGDYSSLRARTAGDRPIAFVYANVAALLRVFAGDMGSGPKAIPLALGLDQVKAAAYGLSFAGDGFRDTLAIHAPGSDHGILPLLRSRPLGDGRFLPMVPAGAFLYGEGTYDLGSILPRVRDLVRQIDARQAEQFDEGLQQANRFLGVDIEHEVMGSLGEGFGLYASFPETGGLFPEVALFLRAKDPAAAESAFDRLAAGIAGAINEKGDAIARTRTLDYRGQRLHLFEIQEDHGDDAIPFTPTWTVLGDALVITLVPHTMKEIVLRSQATGASGLAAQEDFRSLWTGKPAEAMEFWYLDTQAALALLYDTAVPLLQAAVKPNMIPVPIRFDWALLPAARTVRPYFRSMSAHVTANDEGLSFSLEGPVPVMPVIAVAGAAAFAAIRTSSDMRRVPIRRDRFPPPDVVVQPGRDVAQMQMMSMAQAIDIHFLNKRRLPASLEELTRPDPDSGEALLDALPDDPWGRAFLYKVTGPATYRILSLGADGTEGTEDDLVWPE
jgi:hypothetical protein